MPESSFSQQMAEMIARTRLPQAPASRGHRVMGGGGLGSLGGTEKATQADVSVDLGPWMRLFGYKSPEEKEKAIERLQIKKENTEPAQWELWEGSEAGQTVLKGLGKTAGTYQEEGGRWRVMTRTPEAKTKTLYGEPTEGKAKAGFYGPTRREEAIGAEERIEKGRRPLEERMLEAPPEKFAEYSERKAEFEKKMASARLTEPQKNVLTQQLSTLKAEKDVHDLQVQIEQEKINFTPKEREMDKEKFKSELKTATELQGLHRAQAQYYLEGRGAEAREEAKETRDMKRDINKSFDLFLREWNKTRSMATGATDVQRDQLISNLKLETDKYISGMSGISKDLTMGNYPIGFWLSHVEEELTRDLDPKGKLVIPEPGPVFKGKGPEQDIRWQRYAREIVDLVQAMPKDMTDYNLIKSTNLFIKIFEGVTKTPYMVETAKLLVELLAASARSTEPKRRGKESLILESLIKQSGLAPAPPETPFAPLTETPVGPVAP